MSTTVKNELYASLGITDAILENCIPQLFEGLWELGSISHYAIDLLSRQLDKEEEPCITDLGCGKGATLIQYALNHKVKGVGVDLVPEFICCAREYAQRYNVAHKVSFEIGNLSHYIRNVKDQDAVIYGYDSAVLGNIKNTLSQLKNCIKKDGFIVLEVMHAGRKDDDPEIPGEALLYSTFRNCELEIIDKVDWDKNRIKKVNARNNLIISNNIRVLKDQFPDLGQQLDNFFENQLLECGELEEKYCCSTLLLRPDIR